MFGSSVDPHQCATVRVVGSTLAPPIVVVSAWSWASLISCGWTAGPLAADETAAVMLPAALEADPVAATMAAAASAAMATDAARRPVLD